MEATQSKLFTWIPFYGELAEKLIPFRSNQNDLIDLLEELRAAGLTITPMQDKDASGSRFPLAEMDPFTFFAVFNRQINQDMRIRILQELKPRFAMEAKVPSDFAGVPIVNNQSSWFFSYQPKRLPGDVNTLWRVFELALAPHALEHTSFGQAFDEVLKVRGTNINLTMGLFWIRPGTFLNLDGVNRQFLGIKLPRNELSFAFYKETIATVRASRNADFPHLSRDAWDAAEDEGGARRPYGKATQSVLVRTTGW